MPNNMTCSYCGENIDVDDSYNECEDGYIHTTCAEMSGEFEDEHGEPKELNFTIDN